MHVDYIIVNSVSFWVTSSRRFISWLLTHSLLSILEDGFDISVPTHAMSDIQLVHRFDLSLSLFSPSRLKDAEELEAG